METFLSIIPAPIALILMVTGAISVAVGAIRLGYKQKVKDVAYDLVCKAEDSIMGSGQGSKKKKQVFDALRASCPAWLRPIITDEVLNTVIEKAVELMKKALSEKAPSINKE